MLFTFILPISMKNIIDSGTILSHKEMEQLSQIKQDLEARAASVGRTGSMIDLFRFMRMDQCDVLNNSPNTSMTMILKEKEDGLFLTSDADVDEQLLLKFSFQETVKLHSFCIKASSTRQSDASGPKSIKIFVNEPNLGFEDAESSKCVQSFSLSPDQLTGTPVLLHFLKFQNVSSLQIFVEDNQSGSDVTFIEKLSFFGVARDGMDVRAIKKIGEEDQE